MSKIFLNIQESNISFEYGSLIFYFSSEFYKNKFIQNFKNYVLEETLKICNKYNINVTFDIMLMIAYYKKVEKRGFRIFNKRDNQYITENCLFHDDIIIN